MQFSFLSAPIADGERIAEAAENLPFPDADQSDLRYGLSITHRIFTPDDITLSEPDPNDRPYAGALTATGRLVSTRPDRQDEIALTVGVVGPAAGGGVTQRTYHALIGAERPEGWPSQIRSEPVLQLNAQRIYRLDGPRLPGGLETDLLASGGAAVGSLRVSAAAGGQIRLGFDLKQDFGPPRIQPALAAVNGFSPNRGWGGYVFVGGEARGVVRDLFLDGAAVRSGPSVEKRHFVSDVQAGWAVYAGRVQLSFSYVRRSREFENQERRHIFGAVGLSIAL